MERFSIIFNILWVWLCIYVWIYADTFICTCVWIYIHSVSMCVVRSSYVLYVVSCKSYLCTLIIVLNILFNQKKFLFREVFWKERTVKTWEKSKCRLCSYFESGGLPWISDHLVLHNKTLSWRWRTVSIGHACCAWVRTWVYSQTHTVRKPNVEVHSCTLKCWRGRGRLQSRDLCKSGQLARKKWHWRLTSGL